MAVLAAIKDIRYSDLIRTRYPTKRVVTRAMQHDTNSLPHRIMITKEIGKHQAARVPVWLQLRSSIARKPQNVTFRRFF